MDRKLVTLLFSALCVMQATSFVSASPEYDLGGSLASSMGSSVLSSATMGGLTGLSGLSGLSGLNTLGLSGAYPDPGLYPGMYPPTGAAFLPGGGLIRRVLYIVGEIARCVLRIPFIFLRVLTFPIRVIICVIGLIARIALIPAKLIFQAILFFFSLICRVNPLQYRY